jgi:DNA-binding transcriptional ArsR family regulator
LRAGAAPLIFKQVIKYSEPQLDRVFHALADATRRRILERLARGPANVGTLAAPCHMTWPAVTQHLKVLERASLVHRSREGRVHRMRLDPRALRQARAWMDRYRVFWHRQFRALERLLEEPARPAQGKERGDDGGRS